MTAPNPTAISATKLSNKPSVFTKQLDPKLVGLALTGVLALHGLTGYGLSKMTIPDIVPPKVTPPLEITFIKPTTPPEPPMAIIPKPASPSITPPTETKVTPTPVSEPVSKLKSNPKPNNTPIRETQPTHYPKQPKPTGVKTVQDNPQTPVKTTVTPPENQQTATPEPPETQVLSADQLDNDLRNLEIQHLEAQHQAELAKKDQIEKERLAKEQLEKDNQARQDALDQQALEQREQEHQQALAKEAEAKRQVTIQAAIDAKAKKDAQDKLDQLAKEKLAKDLASQAQNDKKPPVKTTQSNNSPVNFTTAEGQAKLIAEPKFDCTAEKIKGETLHMSFTYTVDKQGKIKSVNIAKSSGNQKLDNGFKQDAYRAKFAPFTKDGVPVVGIVTLPFSCKP